ncbi:MAG: PEPxxWA-CTERM sorting domain-containing protein, partial [Proteobacteria bacterium]|nr:PEPxxWA-CTERM sorting domain-containing protein [Pseudomonadota bacterium]
FVGQFSNDTPTPMPDPSCAAGQVLVNFNPGNSTAAGTSNFGAFGPSQTHCITPGSPYTGVFSFVFADGATLFGTTAGYMTPTLIAGVVNSLNTYTITGGTGQFAGATGVINGVGLLDRRPARPLNSLDLTGTVNLPVPEPATWTMMIIGFGAIGGAIRKGRTNGTASFAT